MEKFVSFADSMTYSTTLNQSSRSRGGKDYVLSTCSGWLCRFKQRKNVGMWLNETDFQVSPQCSNLLCLTELISADAEEEDKEHTCETLLMCIVTVLSHGLRSGGGVGDVLRKPSKEVNDCYGREPKSLWRNQNVFPWEKSSVALYSVKCNKCECWLYLKVVEVRRFLWLIQKWFLNFISLLLECLQTI